MTLNLDALRKIAEAATPGPWEIDNLDRVVRTPDRGIVHDDSCSDSEEWLANTDAEFIATFDPPTVLALITELETFRRRFDAMRRQRDGYRNQLRKTERQIQRVREVVNAKWFPTYALDDATPVVTTEEIRRALDGEPHE